MFFMHPVFLIISFVCSFLFSVVLNGFKSLKFNLLYMLPLLLFTAVINPLFNHEGVTILFYLKSGNPVTLESVLYGASAAFMFVSVILWFTCYNAVMTSDKFIYLFGRIAPGVSLIFSMVLRFVPKYKAQIKVISNAQKCIGRDISNGSIKSRAKSGVNILSVMTTWALENAIDTADSMKSRGYGLKGRTSFSIYKFTGRDKTLLLIMLSLIAIIITGMVCGTNSARFFPSIKFAKPKGISILIYCSYALFCLLPIFTGILEEVKWK
jgi:energy-coupling factor transport system permease protein